MKTVNRPGVLYHPQAALMVYTAAGSNGTGYVEYYDIDPNGTPVNSHPLSEKEARQLAKLLDNTAEKRQAFLKAEGLLPPNVLYIDPSETRRVIWYTKPKKEKLFFVNSLGIPNGAMALPGLLWVANRKSLKLYALNGSRKPTSATPLYHAPFMNTGESGAVCMGTVDVGIKKSDSLESFIAAWQTSFFGSYFSHLQGSHCPVSVNLIRLTTDLITYGKPFPMEVLKKTKLQLKNLI